MELVALLPWWAGVALAGLSYWLLHGIATQPVVAPAPPGTPMAFALQNMWRGFAAVGQYLLPIVCLFGAIASAWRHRERARLLETAASSRSAATVQGLSWQQFEHLVGEAFRRRGFRVEELGGRGPDGGVDLVLHKDGERHLVQCKQWRALRVGVEVVRELYGVMAAQGAAGGLVVTSGRYTDAARRFAEGRHIELIDGPALQAMIRPASDAAAPARADLARPERTAVPRCPACTQAMVRRTAQRGARAGSDFWGCPTYPACKGTRPIG
ncbi:MAG TPA: restriction endonuclease [Methylibium sp.]|nr:restriction endonuclease [Methylibium sp.]